MDILTRVTESFNTVQFKRIFLDRLNELISPVLFNPSALFYGEFIESLGMYGYCLIKDAIVYSLETMDKLFYDKPGRTSRYYCKSYRKREIITVFGHIIFKRHEYVDRLSNKPFIYVDESIGLRRKDRYDPCVCAKIYERYGYINSMPKAGKDIGNEIFSPFTLNIDNFLLSIPRQTIWKILHRFKQIDVKLESKDTPSTLYVMADEKYIASQNNDLVNLMVKEVIVHEGLNTHSTVNNETGEVYIRNKLINPRRFINHNEDIYTKVMDYITKTYDTDKIKHIYLMGDGGSWIKDGLYTLDGYPYKLDYGLDKFHYCLAINTISKDDNLKSKLYSYSIGNDTKSFNTLIKYIKQIDPSRSDIITEKAKYIKSNFKAIKTMYKHIKIGCAMEQAISHDLSSQYSSVPKAYSKKWLPYYLNIRENYLNGYNLKKLYLMALDKAKDKHQTIIKLTPKLDLSIFDNRIKDETYSIAKKANLAYIRSNS